MACSHVTAVLDSTRNTAIEVYHLGGDVETGTQRVRRLQHEAGVLAREQVAIFARDLSEMAVLAGEIAQGGDAYPVGIREFASRMAFDLPNKAQLLLALIS